MTFQGKQVDAEYYNRSLDSMKIFLEKHGCEITRTDWIRTCDGVKCIIRFEVADGMFTITDGQWVVFAEDPWPVILEDINFLTLFKPIKE